jgi:hypothetical protein
MMFSMFQFIRGLKMNPELATNGGSSKPWHTLQADNVLGHLVQGQRYPMMGRG